MNALVSTAIAVAVALLTGGWLGYDYGTDKAAAKTQAEYLVKLREAQDETAHFQNLADAAAQNYATAQTELATSRSTAAALSARLRKSRPSAASLSGYSSAALGTGLADAEGDIDRCAGSVERFGNEAGEEAAKVERLKAAYPTRQDARKAREALRK